MYYASVYGMQMLGNTCALADVIKHGLRIRSIPIDVTLRNSYVTEVCNAYKRKYKKRT